ncbi:hypothetical protein FACS189425_06160 [Clostridia bacterium]|nr:hypothetical protein FACS189425_06160 [Clostridia bacterium]
MMEKRNSEWYIIRNAELTVGEERDTFLLEAVSEFGTVSKTRLGELNFNFKRLYKAIATSRAQLDGTSENMRWVETNHGEAQAYVEKVFRTKDVAEMDRIQRESAAERDALFEIIEQLATKHYVKKGVDRLIGEVMKREERVERIKQLADKQPDKNNARYFKLCSELVQAQREYHAYLFGAHKDMLESLRADKRISQREYLKYTRTIERAEDILYAEYARDTMGFQSEERVAVRLYNEKILAEKESELAGLREELENAAQLLAAGGFVRKPIPRSKKIEVKPQTRDEKIREREVAEAARLKAGRRKYL